MKKIGWVGEIKVIGWDLDGTLYPADPELSGEIRARQIGAVAECRGWSLERTRKEYDRVIARLGSHTNTMSELGVDGQEFFNLVWREIRLEEFIKPDEGVVSLFEKLAGRRHFLLSNSNPRDQIERKLGLIGVSSDVFEFVVSTYELGAVKPDPKPFLYCLEKLNADVVASNLGARVEALEVLYVGDRVRTDVRGASGVGMRTCLVWGESEEADVSLPKVYGVAELLGE